MAATTRRAWGRNTIIGIAAVAALVVIGPFVYINFISEDAPPPLTLDSGSSTTTVGGLVPPGVSDVPLTSLDGQWTVTSGSEAGYRVVEVLFGQDNIAVGRTTEVTGTVSVEGTSVRSATLSVDLTSVVSDESRRDNQFRGRIMNTASFPTATFVLSGPLALDGLPSEGVDVTMVAAGMLTLRGQTNAVTAEIAIRRTGNTILAAGSIPVRFEDYDIPDPSVPGISTRDNGSLEFRLNFAKVAP